MAKVQIDTVLGLGQFWSLNGCNFPSNYISLTIIHTLTYIYIVFDKSINNLCSARRALLVHK